MPSDRQFRVQGSKILTDPQPRCAGKMLIEGSDWRNVFVSFTIQFNNKILLIARRKSSLSEKTQHYSINQLPSEVVKAARLLLLNRKRTSHEKREHIAILESAQRTQYLH